MVCIERSDESVADDRREVGKPVEDAARNGAGGAAREVEKKNPRDDG